MKITIDTKADSPEDIRQAISFLKSLLGESGGYSSQPAPLQPQASADLFGMFNDSGVSNASPQESSPVILHESGEVAFQAHEKDEDGKPLPQVVPYS
jgi:hypothetical protein